MRRLLAGALAGLALGAGAAECPPALRVGLPNFPIPPYVLGSEQLETPPGLLIEWLRTAYRRTGCRGPLQIVRRPPNRQLAELALNRLDMLPGFAYAPALLEHMQFPLREGAPDPRLALMNATISLYVRHDERRVHWDGRTLRAPSPRVGSSTGGAAGSDAARAQGWQLESAPTPAADLNKLLARRLDAILEADVVMAPLLATRPRSARRLEPPVINSYRYAPVSRRFAQRYPAFTRRLWHELCVAARDRNAHLPPCR